MELSKGSSRPLPESPAPAAGSPVRGTSSSPFRSPSPSRSPLKSSNPFEIGSPRITPVRIAVNSPRDPHSAHGSPMGSPVRRKMLEDESFTELMPQGRGRDLPPSPTFQAIAPKDPTIGHGIDAFEENLSLRRPLPTADVLRRSTSTFSASTIASASSRIKDKKLDNDENKIDWNDRRGSMISAASTLGALGEDGPPDAPQPRRHKSISRKQVKLVKGNLVLDCPIPTKLYSFLPRRDSDEFVYMRYTACTADPNDFAESGFTIRPAIYDRATELCVCITMYNEDEILFTRTLHSVFKNVAYLSQRSKSKMWGKKGWKKVVVTIVSDGRQKVNAKVLDALAAMGVYQDGVAKNLVNGEAVQSHIFEYTAQVSVTPDLRFQGAEKQLVPIQIIFCMKEKNAKKINSHRWFFNAICPQLNPNVVVLLDVGTKPSTQTLYKLWKAFDEDSNVAGACGEIKTMTGTFGKDLLNPLVAAQNFEYKISNILDKPFESAFGYISVLPGALSAYRFRALQNDPETGMGPLHSYFKGEILDTAKNTSGKPAGIFEKNMYLAEDRILCWELIAKRNEKWVLKYVKDATGETDVPDTLPEFISQRRRWLNGALFAAIYSQTHFMQIWYTDHSTTRKLLLCVEFLYQFFSMLFTFFSIANYYLAFYFVAGSVAGNNDATIVHGGGEALFIIFRYFLILAIAAQFVLSLGNRPQGARALFMITVVVMSIVTVYVTAIGLYFVVKTFTAAGTNDASVHVLMTLVVSLVGTYGVYALMSFLFLDPWHIFTSAVQYFVLVPLYTCTLQIYAFCNTHDVTWGTKGDNKENMDLGAAVVMKDARGKDIVEVEMPSEQIDIDTGYENALHSLRERAPQEAEPMDPQIKQQDYFREVRSRVVLVWMLCNLLLVMLVTQLISLDNPGSNAYLQIILWSTAVFAVLRAAGSSFYLMQHIVRWCHKTNLHTRQKFIRNKEFEIE